MVGAGVLVTPLLGLPHAVGVIMVGAVSGLIVAASGAVAHDLMDRFTGCSMTERQKVLAGKLAAFAVAASANLPAILMLLFWKKTTARGIAMSVLVGIVSAVGLILLPPAMYLRYGLPASDAPIPFNNPGIISIPLSFIALVVVSLMTQKKTETPPVEKV